MADIRKTMGAVWRRFFEWLLSFLPEELVERIRFFSESFGLTVSAGFFMLIIGRRLAPETWQLPPLPSWEWIVLSFLAILLFAEGAYLKYEPLKRKSKAKYEGLLTYQQRAETIVAFCTGVQTLPVTIQQLITDVFTWITDTKAYLIQNFGQDRANIWDSQVENSSVLKNNPPPPAINPQLQLYLYLVWSRLHQLQEIMKEAIQ